MQILHPNFFPPTTSFGALQTNFTKTCQHCIPLCMHTLFLKEVNMKHASRLSTSKMPAFSFDSSHEKELSHVPVRDYNAHKRIWSFIFPHSTTVTSTFNLFRYVLEGRTFLFLYTYEHIIYVYATLTLTMQFFKNFGCQSFYAQASKYTSKTHFSFEVSRNTLKFTAYASVQIQSGVLRVRCSR